MLEGKFLPSLIPREAATSTAMNRHHGPFFGRPPLLAAECEPYSPPVIFIFFFSGVKLSSLPSLSHLKSPPELGSIGRLAVAESALQLSESKRRAEGCIVVALTTAVIGGLHVETNKCTLTLLALAATCPPSSAQGYK